VTSALAAPKYMRPENERRWFVAPRHIEAVTLATWDDIHDRYIDGTRLRLREIARQPAGEHIYKLAKKLGNAPDPRTQLIVNIYLDANEHRALSALPAARLTKRRFHHGDFSVDVFAGDAAGLILCEIEADSLAALDAIAPTSFAGVEVTADPFFTGGSICRATADEIRARVSAADDQASKTHAA
jgi:CYTH domain-containing protein